MQLLIMNLATRLILIFGSIQVSLELELIYPCKSEIYCKGPILEAVNRLQLYNDSKEYVDMPLVKPPNATLKAFNETFPDPDNINKADLADFMLKHFSPAGLELQNFSPTDWVKNPKSLEEIVDGTYRKWAHDLNEIWTKLCKKMDQRVALTPELYSLISVPNEFILPGGRFREFYYWDSYWIMRGLIVSNMTATMKAMIKNYASIVKRNGFIPNGGRVYYLKRSQPPMLTAMVYDYYNATSDIEFVKEMMPALENETLFWQVNRSYLLTGKDNVERQVFRYTTQTNTPRPESLRNDTNTAKNMPEEEKAILYGNIASSAESGWDFSSRWFADKKNLRTQKTKLILPVDLNAFMCGNYKKLSYMFNKVGRPNKAATFGKLHKDMMETMRTLFYNKTAGVWFDYHLDTQEHNTDFYPSNLVPLFADCYKFEEREADIKKLLDYIDRVKALNYEHGVPASSAHTGEQWDFPNAWPPLIHMIIEGLENTKDKRLQDIAYGVADRWIRTNYQLYNHTGHMYEKYDVTTTNTAGSGGEYAVQEGFGWTNGVILDLLKKYGSRLRF